MTLPSAATPAARPLALATLKTVHTVIWLAVESSMAYLLYAGVTHRTDRRAAIAATIVATESAVFLANGARCPLTELAIPLGGTRAPVTDLYLPKWLAHNLPAIHIPLIIAVVYLHARNLRATRSGSRGYHAAPHVRATPVT
ncbi:hypothetical protein AB0M43_17615 [Longispora sp. NPDC051575]|uniref:hypothetical protein n=1 Tax=Longispora sp. NPDC051575 TaxID=3154943 RepID=UPI00341486FB